MNIGLVAIVTSVLLTALLLRIIPDHGNAVMQGRADLCEAIAVNSSVLVSRNDIRRLEAVLQAIVRRNDDVLSAAVRRTGGQMVVEVGEHGKYWQGIGSERSVDTQIYVPISSSNKKWGAVEVRFRPIRGSGVLGFLYDPSTRLVLFVAALSYILFFFYLGRMLQYLDPAKAVPGRVRSALDTLAEGLMVLDKKGRIVLANQAFAACVGQSPEQLLGLQASALPWKKAVDATDEDAYPWLRAIKDEAPQEGIVMGLTLDAVAERTFLVNCTPVQGQDGSYRGVLVSLEDVTQLEEAKVELNKSKDAAEQANAAKSQFLARMSHEIRTPMNAILGFTDVLLRGYADNESQRQEYLSTIHASGSHLLDLINDILDLSKIEAGRMEVEAVRCSPSQLVAQVLATLRIRAEEKGITCGFSAPTGIPETIVTDPVRFRQVLTNLLGNAIKFTETGGVRVEGRLVTSGPKPQLAVDVIDSGIGMSAEALEKIFDPFSQADTTVTRRFGGTGLGLSISRRLANALGGGITVQSTPGEGTIFTAMFDTGPLEGVQTVNPEALAGNTHCQQPAGDGPLQLPPARILVVDDGEANRKLMSVVLRRSGVQIVTGTNGKEAVELASHDVFDAILMDMQMPVMDGYTAAATLRRRGFTRPIIALTADAMHGAEERCRAAGCSEYLTKPIDMDRLLSTLAAVLDGAPAAGRASQAAGVAALATEPGPSPPPATGQRAGAAAESGAKSVADPLGAGRHAPAAAETAPVVSSLPMDDLEFREIVVGWVGRFREQLAAMRAAHERRDFVELGKLAHWLKGAGATVGFAEFTGPATELLRLAREEQADQIDVALAVLVDLDDRIVVPEQEAGCA